MIATLALGLCVSADPCKPGDTLGPFTVKDQHGRDFTFAPGPALLIVSLAMPVAKDANAYLAAQPAGILEQHRALFLSGIHGMPAVGRLFALPKMRKYPHRILLGDDENLLARFPAQDGRLTILRLDPVARITAIEFADPAKDLPSILPSGQR